MSGSEPAQTEKEEAQAAPKPKIFGTLLGNVVRKNMCVGCGSCVASCPISILSMKDDVPTMAGKCILCEYCYYQCPLTEPPVEELEKKVFGRGRSEGESLGVYLACCSARSKLDDALKVGQDGGVVTSLLAYGLQEHLIDCAVVSGVSVEELWKPVPKVASSYKELLACAGTRYTVSPTAVGLRSAVEEYCKNSVGVVGTPCQVRAVRKMQLTPRGVLKLGEKVRLTVGLFCMESFNYDGLIKTYIQQQMGVDLKRVSKFMISKGKFIVQVDGSDAVNVPLDVVKPFARQSCLSCRDFTCELADISVGSVGSPKGWSTVLVRTDVGKKFFEDAATAGFLEQKPVDQVKPGLDGVIKLSNKKRLQATIGQVTST